MTLRQDEGKADMGITHRPTSPARFLGQEPPITAGDHAVTEAWPEKAVRTAFSITKGHGLKYSSISMPSGSSHILTNHWNRHCTCSPLCPRDHRRFPKRPTTYPGDLCGQRRQEPTGRSSSSRSCREMGGRSVGPADVLGDAGLNQGGDLVGDRLRYCCFLQVTARNSRRR
jgi:hypothetical protein